MAKSIRSKRKRKMRNVKRQFYAKKDLVRLKQLADKDLSDLVKLKSAQEVQMVDDDPATVLEESDSKMDVEGSSKEKTYDKKTKQDENGHYPPWMHQRAIKKHKKQILKRKSQKKIGKKIKW